MILKITPYYFDGIININGLDLNNIWLDEKSHEIYDVKYKILYDLLSIK